MLVDLTLHICSFTFSEYSSSSYSLPFGAITRLFWFFEDFTKYPRKSLKFLLFTRIKISIKTYR